jgi:purine nucleosidase
VTAYLLAPELFAGRNVRVDIECVSPLTLGASVVDWWSVRGEAPNALVLRSIDAEGYFRLIFARLLRL